MNDEFTTPEEYQRLRQEHIVNGLYGGDDNLPLESKEQLLLARYPGVRFSFHRTDLDADGRDVGDGHMGLSERVDCLESQILDDMGLVNSPL